jgi:sarcosine oxidase
MKVVVIGGGAMGAPATQVLAERGHEVILLDRFGIPNAKGGSGFGLRSFRLSHYAREDVRLALRSLELYLDIQRRTGIEVYRRLGILHLGEVVAPMSAAFDAEGVPYRAVGPAEVASVFPELRPRYDQPMMFQPDGGVNCCVPFLQACVGLARARGAEVSPRERVITLQPGANGVRVFTDRRRIDADVAVVTAGPWTNELLEPIGMGLPLQPGIVQVSYFKGAFGDDAIRPSIMERTRGAEDAMYGLIGPGQGYKMGFAVIDRTKFFQDLTARPLDPPQERRLGERVREDFPGFHTGPFDTECGVITLTPDDQFIIDRRGPIVVGAGCMGHAFKFAPALGEFLADLAEDRPLPTEMDRFRMDRPGLNERMTRNANIPVVSS